MIWPDSTVPARQFNRTLAQDLARHNQPYPVITVREFADSHDRFLTLDGETIYHFGASLKDLGKKWFAFYRMDKSRLKVMERLEEVGMENDWPLRPLGDVLSFANGKASPERTDDGKFSIFGSNGSIGRSDLKNSPENTIVIGRVGSYCGSTFFSKAECWVTDNAIRANAKADCDANFACYLLQTLNLNERRAGSGQPLLNQSIPSTIDMAVPPFEEQRGIAHILGTLDDKIELNRKQNETLEAMARALFKTWFVDFEPVRAKMEGRWRRGQSLPGLPAHLYDLFPDRLVDSELREIPEGWMQQRVGDIGLIICGKNTIHKSSRILR